jgi:tRNA U34 2-thiouridine synthase MnmA/TrmU
MNLIRRAKDANKDQTYFIWQIKQEQLPHILFPVGEFDVKSEVREYAQSKGLITSNKPDSQGLCFVGQTSLRDMLLQTLGRKDGFIYTYLDQKQIDQIGLKVTKKTRGEINSIGQFKIKLGEHEGAFLFTIGQRQNLGLSNGPWFVAEVDIVNNEVIVCHNEFQENIMSQFLLIEDLNWHLDVVNEIAYTKSKELTTKSEKLKVKSVLNKVDLNLNNQAVILDLIQDLKSLEFASTMNFDLENYRIFQLRLRAQIRYRSQSQNCTVFVFIPKSEAFENPPDRILNRVQDDNYGKAFAIVEFDQPIKAAAKGQSIVFYDYYTDQYLLGGGVIKKVLQ